MTCSDDDLKRLLSSLVNCEFESQHPKMDMDWYEWIKRVRDEILPLSRKAITRLEAAEEAMRAAQAVINNLGPSDEILATNYAKTLEAWRKAAGK